MSAENRINMKAIVVDDEPVIKDIVTTLLDLNGYAVSAFEDSLEALENAKKVKYNVIISDYYMPRMNGIDLIQKIKETNPYIASILITGVGSERTVIEAFTKGNVNNYVIKPFNNSELLRIIRLAIREQEIKIKEDKFQDKFKEQLKKATKRLNEKNKLLRTLSITDSLSGLYNHRYFQKRMKEEFLRAKRYDLPLSCLMIDIDDFKKVNDTYGHQVGDRTIVEFAGILNSSIRTIDIAARYGGEEFAVLLPQIEIEGAKNVAERFRKNVESHAFLRTDKSFNITASIGVASYPNDDMKSDEDLLKIADNSLYRAKNIGKNKVVVHTILGEEIIGGTEFLTMAEKWNILSDITAIFNRTLSIDDALKTFLGKMRDIYSKSNIDESYSVILINKNGELSRNIHTGENENYNAVMMAKAQEAVRTRKIQIYHSGNNETPLSSIPVITDEGTENEKVIAVLNIGAVIDDRNFLRDITNILSIAIKGGREKK